MDPPTETPLVAVVSAVLHRHLLFVFPSDLLIPLQLPHSSPPPLVFFPTPSAFTSRGRMGKKRHQNDRLYLSQKEWKDMGGKREAATTDYQRLPFDHCALTLLPFTTPVCDSHGNVFELMSIIPYLQEHKRNPVTGAPLHFRDLIRLDFKKNSDGEFIDPVSFKPFGPHTHIVAIRTSGKVYSFETIDELCLKQTSLTDLITGEAFTREDILTIQDPHQMKQRRLLTPQSEEQKSQSSQPTSTPPSATTAVALPSSAKPSSAPVTVACTSSSSSPPPSTGARGVQSSFRASGSFTSTALTPVTSNVRLVLTDAEKRDQWYESIRKAKKDLPAYLRLHTSHGPINLQLFCHLAPRTCHNFLTLASSNYYDQSKCHRLIPGFMAQFGDPTGTGRGGRGAFSATFEDEIHQSLKHDKKGCLSMANAGKNTNSSQFFLTFARCSHLDGKHAIFGQVVGGYDTLDSIEAVDVGKGDRPLQPVTIERIEIFENPFKDGWVARDALTGEREDAEEKKRETEVKEAEDNERRAWFSRPTGAEAGGEVKPVGHLLPVVEGGGGGQKRKALALPAPKHDEDDAAVRVKKKQAMQTALAQSKMSSSAFNFSSW